jgi:hypothetical protein
MKMKMTASIHNIFDKQKWWEKRWKGIECKWCNYLVSPVEVILVQYQATSRHNNYIASFVIEMLQYDWIWSGQMIIKEMLYIPIKLKPELARVSMTTSDVNNQWRSNFQLFKYNYKNWMHDFSVFMLDKINTINTHVELL